MDPQKFRGFYQVDLFDCEPFEMFTAGDDALSEYILEGKRFEPHSIRTMQRLLGGASCFLDVGASVGVYSLVAAKTRPGLPVFAFEPNSLAYARLILHVAQNGFEKNIRVFQSAIGDTNNIRHFTWLRKQFGWISSGGHLLQDPSELQDARLERFIAQSITLDSIMFTFPDGKPLIKIDVEGGEIDVFRGMSKLLSDRKPDIILECFHTDHCEALTAVTKPLGYRYYKIDEDGFLLEQDRLIAAGAKSDSLNQLLTITPQPEECIRRKK